jgi:hypothetical protein
MQQSISGFAILHNVLSYIATVTPEESLFFWKKWIIELSKHEIKAKMFRDVAPCSLVNSDRRFRGAYCLHQASETSFSIYQTIQRNIPEDSHLQTLAVRTWNLINYQSMHFRSSVMWVLSTGSSASSFLGRTRLHVAQISPFCTHTPNVTNTCSHRSALQCNWGWWPV